MTWLSEKVTAREAIASKNNKIIVIKDNYAHIYQHFELLGDNSNHQQIIIKLW